MGDGLRIVKPRHDQNRHAAASDRSTQLRTGDKPIETRHEDIQDHYVRPYGCKQVQRLSPAIRLTDFEARLFELVTHNHPGQSVIINNESQWCRSFSLRSHI